LCGRLAPRLEPAASSAKGKYLVGEVLAQGFFGKLLHTYLEAMPADHLPLERLGMLNGRQTKGDIVKHASAVGTPLTLEKRLYETGLGTHATSFIEFPLAGQFKAFEVTVGIDAVTEGRGSAVFRIFVDGKERASSGVVNGF